MKAAHSSNQIPLAMAKPAEACDPLQQKDYRGKAVLVRRGTCSFVQKAENVQAAGGVAMLVGSVHTHLLRMVSDNLQQN
jgi:minor extracellular serine protease Vpr